MFIRYEFDDPDLIHFIKADDGFTAAFNSGIVLEDMIPGLKFVYKSRLYREIEDFYRELVPNFTAKRFHEEKKTYDPGTGSKAQRRNLTFGLFRKE